MTQVAKTSQPGAVELRPLGFAALPVLLSLACLIGAVTLSLLCGVTWYSPATVVSEPEARSIVWNLRMPRTVCAVLVGAGLAIVGTTYQSIFKNYLASPFTLGVSSGAALAASAAVIFGFTSSRHGIDVGLCALVGAFLSIVVILGVHRRQKARDSNSLLLVGIVFSFFCSSLMTLMQYLADYSQLFQVTRWMMGGIPSIGWSDLGIGAVCVSVTFVWALRNARGLDLLLFGDDVASVKGIHVAQLTSTMFVFTSFVVGWVVAQCGIIGFVGIIVPAVARILVGISHVRVLPLAAVLGALLVVACDVLGRLVVVPFEVPAGVFTAVLGGPAFVLLLLFPPRRR
jgi:iron complex transport system permease protein